MGNCSKCCWKVFNTYECRAKYSSKLILNYTYLYIHGQVIQNCTTLSRVDISENKDGKQQDLKQRKRKPGKHCVVMFCNKTNAD